jgi:hypothetical protein
MIVTAFRVALAAEGSFLAAKTKRSEAPFVHCTSHDVSASDLFQVFNSFVNNPVHFLSDDAPDTETMRT